MKNLLIVLLVGGFFFGSLYVYNKQQQQFKKDHEYLNWEAEIAGNSFPEEPLMKSVRMAINPSIELDYKSKAEVYELRRQYVNQYPELAPKDYKPSDVIFGQIIDGKPWWGEVGISHYGSGESSVAGMSEESRHLANPFLLVSIDPALYFPCHKRYAQPKMALPVALEMMWESRTKAHAYFDVSGYRNRVLRCGIPEPQVNLLMMPAYNARDFGYNYLAVDLTQSENILPFGAARAPQQNKQFIHMGPSCGHPSMCNNMSPHDKKWFMPFKKLPAKAHIKLWKKEPASILDPEDLTFIIYMI